MPCGVVLREILKHEPVTALILHDQSAADEPSPKYSDLDTQVPQSGDGVFWEFFDYIDKSVFEVSADAFNTFRVGLQDEVVASLTWHPGNSGQTQTSRGPVAHDQLQSLLPAVQLYPHRIEIVSRKEAVNQAARRDPPRQSQLQHHDRIRFARRASEAMHESTARR